MGANNKAADGRTTGNMGNASLNEVASSSVEAIEDVPAGVSFVAMAKGDVIKKSHKAKRKRRILTIVGVAVALFACAGIAFAAYMNHIGNLLNKGDKTDDELNAIDSALATTYETSLNEPFYMMLIGSDRREADASMGARSDVNIVVRVDPQTFTVNLVSIPRDTKIEIDGYGTQKFNAAYAFNGAAGAIEAAEKLLGIEISHYAEVNFSELANLIDAIGGVTVTVEEGEGVDDEKCDDFDGNHYVIGEGVQTLTGPEALTFARSRAYPTGDFIRTKHQRQLIEAVAQQVTKLSLDKIPGVITAACKCVTTDLSVTDIIGLAQKFANADELKIYSAMLPSYTQNINGISFVINDTELTAQMMALVAQGQDISGIESTKTAEDTYSGYADTSQTLLFSDDDAYEANSEGEVGAQVSSSSAQASSASSSAQAASASSSAASAAASASSAASSGASASQDQTGSADSVTEDSNNAESDKIQDSNNAVSDAANN